MNKERLLKLIQNGGSLDKNLQDIQKTSGYMVSKYGAEKTYKKDDIKNIEKTILEYRKNLKESEYIGIWTNKDITYIDISKHYKDKKQAIQVGKNNKQLAIFDLKNSCDIPLLVNVYIVYKYNKYKNDYKYIKEFTSTEELKKEYKLNNNKSIYNYIKNSIEEVTSLLLDQYTIIKESCYYVEIEG